MYPSWFKTLIIIGLAAIVFAVVLVFRQASIESVVDDQLALLRAGKVKEAYEQYTSKQFKQDTSIEKFSHFILANPILQNYASSVVQNEENQGKTAYLNLQLKSKDGTPYLAQFTLVKESDDWKVVTIRLTKSMAASLLEQGSPAYVEPIHIQLEALHQQHLNAAYESIVSNEFKHATPFDKFQEFVQKYPILTNYQSASLTNNGVEGEEAFATVILQNDNEQIPVEYRLVQEEGKWKIKGLKLILPEQFVEASSLDAALLKPVKEQLELLKENKLDDAYQTLVTEEFKKATSLDQFKQFVKKYPILTDSDSTQITKGAMEEDVAKLYVNLKKGDETTTVEYVLSKVGDTWKIMGLQLFDKEDTSSPPPEKDSKNFNPRPLQKAVENIINTIKKQDYQAAYDQYTAAQFKQSTSFDKFKEFVTKQPAFARPGKYNFPSLTFNNNIATYTGTMVDNEGKQYLIEMDLIQDESQWKLLHIEIKEQKSSGEKHESAPANGKNFGYQKNHQGQLCA